MFKKLKDKLAEEVKSSPQRIQQFAQAAQAAVTSASSSISDITNSDLFSIGENDNPQSRPSKSQSSLSSQNTFQDVALVQPLQSPTESADYMSSHDILENQTRQRRLSNSSFASDVSFRLPSYETPSMYHLQSDMEVSASEAEERGFSSGAVSLDRVTKEQLYSAYRRTQERYKKYRTQYGDLARHYKLLERENAKARSVLVETQDKALRRISELREQCALEQSAKAHLEKALRIELEEKNMKIETLNTKIQLLQSDPQGDADSINMNKVAEVENDVPLINLANDNDVKDTTDVAISEINTLNNKIEKMELLLNKYKDSLKTSKEKNSQMTTEIQILSNELENKNKEIEILQHTAKDLATANNKIQELSNLNEELQNKINVYEFNKTREQSTLQLDLQKSQEEIIELKGKIEIFTKREEDYAISLAENKLSIHKELESKENEIKSLKDALEISKKEIQSLNIVIDDYKNNVTILESDKAKIQNECVELATAKSKVVELETKIEELSKKCHSLEQSKSKADEEYKCLQLQLKQETAEKLAMIDRNTYLENRNTQLGEDNSKKSSQISVLEAELKKRQMDQDVTASEDSKLNNELSVWKEKYAKLESEIQEERDELIKLQSEIEKLLVNHELIQTQNLEFRQLISDLKNENMSLLEQSNKLTNLESRYVHLKQGLQDLRKHITVTFDDTKSLQKLSLDSFNTLSKQINDSLNNITHTENDSINSKLNDLKTENERLETDLKAMIEKTKVMSIEITNLLDENNNLKGTVDKVKYEKQEINDNMKSATEKYDKIIHEVNSLKEINGILNEKANAYEHKIKDLQAAVDLESVRYREVVEKLKSIENAEQKLQETHQNMLQKSELVATESNKLKSQCIILTEELEILKKENDCLLTKSKQLEDEKQNFNKLEDDIKILTRENQTLRNQHQSAQQEMDRGINFVTEELKKLKKDYENIADERDSLKKENDILVPQIEELKRKTENFVKLQEELNTLTDENLRKTEGLIKLQEELNTLTDENLSLKTQAESLSSSFKDMEVEINDLRERHTQMEAEKDRLNDIIEKLETSPNQTTEMRNNNIEEVSSNVTLGDSYTQTEVVEPSINNIPVIENVHAIHVTENQAPKQSSNDNNSELQEKYIHVKEEYDLLKEENRRLKSDIEGLQTYLTKISKENSVLNDKLRESIATSEHSIENNDSIDVVELKNEIQSWKDKNEDLLRENNFLIEENLELKDQLQSQNYSKPAYNSMDDGANDVFPKEKYNDLLQKNSSLEKRLLDLENMNKSVNVNLLQMQDKNDKLRSSNEKLERRLDEALVSLRHLHSLQENTELEYLRNILYEYLTGPGIHSVTLAKVLSAIVKFDDMQTKLVLQKEKERQGFLRQLGII